MESQAAECSMWSFLTKILEVNLFAFECRLFYEVSIQSTGSFPDSLILHNLSLQLGCPYLLADAVHPVDWREIFMKQCVHKCKQINF